MLLACVIVLEPLLMRAKRIGCRVEKVLCFIEVAGLVEGCGAGVDGVGLERRKAGIFAESVSSFRW